MQSLSTIFHKAKKHRTKLSGFVAVLFLALSRPTAHTILYGTFPILLGQLIRIWSSGHIHKNQILAVTGPYSLSRNPLYVGSFILGTGFMVAMGVIWMVIAFLAFYASVYWFTIRWEEDKLAKEFPDEWGGYKRTVPRFLPLTSLPKYLPGEFSWRQVTKHKEMMNASVVLAVYAILWAKAVFMGSL